MKRLIITENKKKAVLLGLTLLGFILLGCLASTSATDLSLPCTITTYGNAWEGTLAFGLYQFDPNDIWTEMRNYLVVMNTNGTIQYIRDTNPKAYNIVTQVDPDTILFTGEPRKNINLLDTNTLKVTKLPQLLGHHDVVYDPDTENVLTLHKDIVTIDGMEYEHDRLVPTAPNGTILWSWTTADYFPHDIACNYSRIRKNSLDLTHCNSIDWHIDQGIVYVNIRNLNTFCKINATNGEHIWSLGEHGDFTLQNIHGTQVPSLWYRGHSVEEVEPDVFLLFDNDLHNITNIENKRSRILEITINEQNMTAWTSWKWTAPREKYSGYWGDADRLPSGNRLGIFGTQHHDHENSTGAWLVEVNPEGNIVREIDFPLGWGMYRCEIIDSPNIFGETSFNKHNTRITEDQVTLIYSEKSHTIAKQSETALSDWQANSILYTGLPFVTEKLSSDPLIVNQTTGKPLLDSGTLILTTGGPQVNPITAYYEAESTPLYDRAPLTCNIVNDTMHFNKLSGESIVSLPLNQVNSNTDFFLFEVFRDGRGRLVTICYGFGWKGTITSAKYAVKEYDSIKTSDTCWVVVQWTDPNMNGFVNGPDDGDTYSVIEEG